MKKLINEKIQDWQDCAYRCYNGENQSPEILIKAIISDLKEIESAWLDGYTVEKEPLYYVRLKNATEAASTNCYLWLNQALKKYTLGLRQPIGQITAMLKTFLQKKKSQQYLMVLLLTIKHLRLCQWRRKNK